MMQHLDDHTTGTYVQSVQRAAHLLKAFDMDNVELGVNELSRRVGLHKSTVSRLLATLEHEGLVERVPGNDKFRLGFLLVRLAGRASHFNDLRAVARPVLFELSECSGETVHLAVLDGQEVVNIEQLSGPHLVRETNWVGRRTPFHCVANGKVILAFQPRETIAKVLSRPLLRYTERTIVSPARLREELADIRARGYAQSYGEIEVGLNGVAAPVRDASGATVAAVSVSGPAYRITERRADELATLTLSAAGAIAARLGYTMAQ